MKVLLVQLRSFVASSRPQDPCQRGAGVSAWGCSYLGVVGVRVELGLDVCCLRQVCNHRIVRFALRRVGRQFRLLLLHQLLLKLLNTTLSQSMLVSIDFHRKRFEMKRSPSYRKSLHQPKIAKGHNSVNKNNRPIIIYLKEKQKTRE